MRTCRMFLLIFISLLLFASCSIASVSSLWFSSWYPFLLSIGFITLNVGLLAWNQAEERSLKSPNTAGRIGFVVMLIGGLILVMILLHFYVSPETDESKATIAQIGVAIVAGTVVASGSYVGWQSLQVSRHRLNLDTESEITRNFTATVEQLGSRAGDRPNLDIRIGGLIALGAIADSWFARGGEIKQYWATIRVLAAYILENQKRWNQRRPDPVLPNLWELRSDIEVAIDVLSQRRDLEYQHLPFEMPNLRGVNFSGVEVSRRDFRRCDLSMSQFRRAVAPLAKFQDASLMYANFEGANLIEARFEGANLRGAFFSHMVFRDGEGIKKDANPYDVESAHLRENESLVALPDTGASLMGADFTGVDLTQTHGLVVAELVQAKGIQVELLPHEIRHEYAIQKNIYNATAPIDDIGKRIVDQLWSRANLGGDESV